MNEISDLIADKVKESIDAIEDKRAVLILEEEIEDQEVEEEEIARESDLLSRIEEGELFT
jgi:hypothetical protein